MLTKRQNQLVGATVSTLLTFTIDLTSTIIGSKKLPQCSYLSQHCNEIKLKTCFFVNGSNFLTISIG